MIAQKPKRSTSVDAATLRRLAVEAEADPRTILKVLRGEPVRGVAGYRVTRVLREAGLLGEANPNP